MIHANPDARGFNPGAVPSVPDERDYQYENIARAPIPFNWKKGFNIEKELGHELKPKDQGVSSSCGGQAWAVLSAVMEELHSKTYEERSAKFIYAQTAVPSGGSTGRSNADVYVKKGSATESLTPSYMGTKTPTEAFMQRRSDITPEAWADGLRNTSLSYAAVNRDVDSIAQAVRDNGGVIIGICGSDNGTWRSDYPGVPNVNQTIWRHWLYVGKAKILRGKKYIGVLNSWGTNAGTKGWQWISEDYVKTIVNDSAHRIKQQAVWEAWVHVFNSESSEPKVSEVVSPLAFTYEFSKTIRFGQRSSEVNNLQKALQIEGCFPAATTPTDYYGPVTAASVLKFQIKHAVAPMKELTNLGGRLVGPSTRVQLNKLFNK